MGDDADGEKYTIQPTNYDTGIPYAGPDIGEIRPGMTEYEISHALEQRRVIALPPFKAKYSATYLDICIREDPWLIFVKRTVRLMLMQERTHTIADVHRVLQIKYYDMARSSSLHRTVTVNTDAKSKKEYERAKKEAAEASEKYVNPNEDIRHVDVEIWRKYITGGERGITSGARRMISIGLAECGPDTKTEEGKKIDRPAAYIDRVLHVEESCVALPEVHLGYGLTPLPKHVTEFTREALEEIQGVIEWFFVKRGEKVQGRPLDRGTTNILEPWKPGGKCGFCAETHRTGDYLLPWE
jgi:hypothetical protein